MAEHLASICSQCGDDVTDLIESGRGSAHMCQGRKLPVLRDGARYSGIYIASKAKHYERWLKARASGVPIISTWINEGGNGQTVDWSDLWSRAIAEASNCSVLVIYEGPGETMKGALVELGAAIASGATVLAVGFTDRSRNHPAIIHCTSITEAFLFARQLIAAESEPSDG